MLREVRLRRGEVRQDANANVSASLINGQAEIIATTSKSTLKLSDTSSFSSQKAALTLKPVLGVTLSFTKLVAARVLSHSFTSSSLMKHGVPAALKSVQWHYYRAFLVNLPIADRI